MFSEFLQFAQVLLFMVLIELNYIGDFSVYSEILTFTVLSASSKKACV